MRIVGTSKKQGILFALMAAFLFSVPAFAVVSINSQGTSLAPVSVTTGSAVKVIPANGNRLNWAMFSESSDLRCTAGTYTQASGAFAAPGTAPTASVGFIIKQGQYINEKALFLSVYSSGPNAITEDEAKVEIDCIALSATTNVDTWEETTK